MVALTVERDREGDGNFLKQHTKPGEGGGRKGG